MVIYQFITSINHQTESCSDIFLERVNNILTHGAHIFCDIWKFYVWQLKNADRVKDERLVFGFYWQAKYFVLYACSKAPTSWDLGED